MNCSEMILNINRDYEAIKDISDVTMQLRESARKYIVLSETYDRQELLSMIQSCNQKICVNMLDVLARREALNHIIEYELKRGNL